MKTIGLIGGLSWASTIEYYRQLNEAVQAASDGQHAAQILLFSFDWNEIQRLQHTGDWPELNRKMISVAQTLEWAGADFLLIASNTMHKLAPVILEATLVPLLHIADPTGEALRAAGLTHIGLLGARFTMEEEFYRRRLTETFEVTVSVPDLADRQTVHRIIYDELVKGIVTATSQHVLEGVCERLARKGAQGFILGCTELMLSLKQERLPLPLFDTTTLHVKAAARAALVD